MERFLLKTLLIAVFTFGCIGSGIIKFNDTVTEDEIIKNLVCSAETLKNQKNDVSRESLFIQSNFSILIVIFQFFKRILYRLTTNV